MNDPEIRALLRPHLTAGHLIEELPVGNTEGSSTQADVVHITDDLMHGYELKGDGDSLKRVPMQARVYGLVCDRVTFVVTSKHLARLYLPGQLPAWAGVAQATPEGIHFITPALPVPTLDRTQLGALLWQTELVAFLKAYNIKAPTRLRVWECCDLLQNKAIPLEVLRAYVRERLVARLLDKLLNARRQRQLLAVAERG